MAVIEEKLGKADVDDDFGSFNFDDIPGEAAGMADPDEGGDRGVVDSVFRGARESIVNTATDTRQIRSLAERALPDGYKFAFRGYDEAAKAAEDITGAMGGELKPVAVGLAKSAKRLIPKSFTGTQEMLDKVISKYGISRRSDPRADAEARMQGELGSIFDLQKLQVQQNAVNSKQQAAGEAVKELRDNARHNTMSGIMTDMSAALARQVAMHESISIPYQRKHLELAYRQLATQQELTAASREFFTKSTLQSEAIIKNTKLPDFLKMRGMERLTSSMHQRGVDSVINGVFGSDGFVGRRVGKLKGDLVSAYGSASGRLSDLSDMVESTADAADMSADFIDSGMVTKEELMAKGFTDLAAGEFIRVMGNKGRAFIDKNPSGVISKFGAKLEALAANPEEYANRMAGHNVLKAKDTDHNWVKNAKSYARNWLSNGGETEEYIALKNDSTEAAQQTRSRLQADRSLIEVIPGYLARILRSTEFSRTGTDPGMTEFDSKAGKFSSSTEIQNRVSRTVKALVKKDEFEGSAAEVVDKLFEGVELDEDTRGKLLKYIKQSAFSNNIDSGAVYGATSLNTEGLHEILGKEKVESLVAESIAKFKDSDGNIDVKKERDLSSAIERLRRHGKVPVDVINAMAKDGYLDKLMNIGAVKKAGNVNAVSSKFFQDLLLGNATLDDLSEDMDVTPPPAPRPPLIPPTPDSGIRDEQPVPPPPVPTSDPAPTPPTPPVPRQDDIGAGGEYTSRLDTIVELLTSIRDKPNSSFSAEQFNSMQQWFSNLRLPDMNINQRLTDSLDALRNSFTATNYNEKVEKLLESMNSNLASMKDTWPSISEGLTAVLGVTQRIAIAGGIGLGVAGKYALDKAPEIIKQYRETTGKVGSAALDMGKRGTLFAGKGVAGVFGTLNKMLGKEGEEVPDEEFDMTTMGGMLKGVSAQGLKLVGNVFQRTSDGLNTLINTKLPAGYGMVAGMAGKLWDKVKDFVDGPTDVYVIGTEGLRRVLRKEIMQVGGYYNKFTNTKILKLTDIAGPVISADTQSEVITMEEFANGLYDANGNRLGGTMRNAWRLLSKTLAKPLGRLAKVAGAISPLKMPEFLKDKLGGVFGDSPVPYVSGEESNAPAGNLTSETNKILRDIRSILQGKFGNGIVDDVVGNATAAKKAMAARYKEAKEIVKGTADSLGADAKGLLGRVTSNTDMALLTVMERTTKILEERLPEPVKRRAGNWMDRVKGPGAEKLSIDHLVKSYGEGLPNVLDTIQSKIGGLFSLGGIAEKVAGAEEAVDPLEAAIGILTGEGGAEEKKDEAATPTTTAEETPRRGRRRRRRGGAGGDEPPSPDADPSPPPPSRRARAMARISSLAEAANEHKGKLALAASAFGAVGGSDIAAGITSGLGLGGGDEETSEDAAEDAPEDAAAKGEGSWTDYLTMDNALSAAGLIVPGAGALSGLFGGGEADTGADEGATPPTTDPANRDRRTERRERRAARRAGGGGPTPPNPAPQASQGFLGKLKHLGGRGLQMAGEFGERVAPKTTKVLKFAGNAAKFLGKGAFQVAKTVAMNPVARTAAMAALGGVDLAAIGAGAGAVFSAIAGTISLPVLLGAGAIAAVGVGGYMAYKYFTRNNTTSAGLIRLLQYGFDKTLETEYHRVMELEQAIPDSAIGFSDDQGYIKSDGLDIEKLMKIFDVDPSDVKASSSFVTWFDSRFKPVFLTHKAVMRGIDAKLTFDKLDDLKVDDRVKYIRGAAMANGPYDIKYSPIPTIPELPDTRAATANLVKTLLGEASEKYKKLTGNELPMYEDKRPAGETGTMEAPPKLPTPPTPSAGLDSNGMPVTVPAADGVPAVNAGTLPADPGTGPLGQSGMELPPPPPGPFTGAPGTQKALSSPDGGEGAMKLGGNFKSSGLVTEFWDRLRAAAKRYFDKTGKKLFLTSGFRSREDQERMIRLYPQNAAKVGSSAHEFGLAVDADTGEGVAALNEMDRMGILKEEGLTRPVGGEPWHVEPAGIQRDLAKAKADQAAARKMILQGLGGGGKGYGSIPGTPKRKRNFPMALALLNEAGPIMDDALPGQDVTPAMPKDIAPQAGFSGSIGKTIAPPQAMGDTGTPSMKGDAGGYLKTSGGGLDYGTVNSKGSGIAKGGDSAAHVIAKLQSLGWTQAQAVGIAANLKRESQFDPTAVGDGGKAYGIGQWHPDRQAAFMKFKGRSIKGSSLDDQLEFLTYEMTQGTERGAGKKLKATSDHRAAAMVVSQFYERPADKEGEKSKRAALADSLAGVSPAMNASLSRSIPSTLNANAQRDDSAMPVMSNNAGSSGFIKASNPGKTLDYGTVNSKGSGGAAMVVSQFYERPADKEGEKSKRAALADSLAGVSPAMSTQASYSTPQAPQLMQASLREVASAPMASAASSASMVSGATSNQDNTATNSILTDSLRVQQESRDLLAKILNKLGGAADATGAKPETQASPLPNQSPVVDSRPAQKTIGFSGKHPLLVRGSTV